MGDHRKALAYTRYILEYLDIDKDSLTSQEDQGYSPEDLRDLLEATPQVRLFLQMNCWASTPETTIQKFLDIQSSDLDRHRPDASDQPTSSIVDSVQDMITSKFDQNDVLKIVYVYFSCLKNLFFIRPFQLVTYSTASHCRKGFSKSFALFTTELPQ